jgi:hypothetical protein
VFNQREYNKKYYQEHKKYFKKHSKQYRIDNLNRIKKLQKQWRSDNCEKIRDYMRKWYKNNPEKLKSQQQRWKENNLEKVRAISKQWQKNNSKKVNKYHRNKHKIDLRFNLNGRISGAIYKSLRGNKEGRHWETLVGYSLSDLIKYLRKKMPIGYCWQDFLEGKLHIDHIIPKSVFNYTHPRHTDFKRCWALYNLRLLPARENRIKYNKLSKPFQPALKI